MKVFAVTNKSGKASKSNALTSKVVSLQAVLLADLEMVHLSV